MAGALYNLVYDTTEGRFTRLYKMFQSGGTAVPDLKQRYKHKDAASNDKESLLATIKTSVLEVAAHRDSAEYEAEKMSIKSMKDTKKSRGKKKNDFVFEEVPKSRGERKKARNDRKARGAMKDVNDKKMPAAESKKRKGGRSSSAGGKKKSNVAAASSYGPGDEDYQPAPPVYPPLPPLPEVEPQQKSE